MTIRTFRMLAVVGGLALLAPVAVHAQEHKGCACCARAGHAGHGAAAKTPAAPAPLADAATTPAPPYRVESEGLFSGVITSVMRHQGMDVELTLGAGENTFEVLVAPLNWLDAKQASFRPGERVEVVGAPWDRGTGEAIIAREIRSTGQTLVVRDSEGRPLWN